MTMKPDPKPKFISIASGLGLIIYALDDEGDVWKYYPGERDKDSITFTKTPFWFRMNMDRKE